MCEGLTRDSSAENVNGERGEGGAGVAARNGGRGGRTIFD